MGWGFFCQRDLEILCPSSLVSAPSPLPRRHRLWISPQALLRVSCILLQPFKDRISRRIFPILPTPALLYEFLIDVHSIQQEHVSKGARVLVLAVGLDGDLFPKGEGRGSVLGVVAVGLALLRAVDAAQTDTFMVLVVQDFDGVAVNYPDYSSDEVGSCQGSAQQKKDSGTAAAKTGSSPTSQSSAHKYPSRWASTTN